MKLQTVSQLFQPRLEVRADERMGWRVTNTLGDTLDPDYSAMIPKAYAEIGENEKGEEFVKVTHNKQEQWIPKGAFTETPGEHGVYYLPTYKDSARSAVLSGALRGTVALGIFGAGSGIAGGLAGTLIPSDSRAVKYGAAALAGAAVTMAGQYYFQGNTALPLAALLGGVSGVGAALAGSGESRVRDCLYGGVAAGMALSIFTGSPMMAMVSGGTAAGLAAQANNKPAQVATGAAVGGAIGAAQALLSGSGNAGMAAALGAAVGAVGPLIGPPLMQLSRNLAQIGGDKIRDFAKTRSDTELKLLSGVPTALSYGLIGSSLAIMDPQLGTIGAAVGAVIGGAKGIYVAHHRIEELKKKERAAVKE